MSDKGKMAQRMMGTFSFTNTEGKKKSYLNEKKKSAKQ